jgi:hypothetical protein
VLAQVWRSGGPRQARISMLLSAPGVKIQDLNRGRAQSVGELCRRSKTSDIVDASVVVAAWTSGRIVVTSDVEDIRRLDPSLTIIKV